MTAKWGIWCLSEKGWVYDQAGCIRTDVTFDRRRDAKAEMDDMAMKHTRHDYEVRSYNATKETTDDKSSTN